MRPLNLMLAVIGLVVGLVVGLIGCSRSAPPDQTLDFDMNARAERIQVLTRAIRDDHARLEELITQPDTVEGRAELHQHPEIESIAKRLDAHERELAGLEALDQRATR
jgi:uncharacterized membrane-anchored protein YhcB (DUF1043 family)